MPICRLISRPGHASEQVFAGVGPTAKVRLSSGAQLIRVPRRRIRPVSSRQAELRERVRGEPLVTLQPIAPLRLTLGFRLGAFAPRRNRVQQFCIRTVAGAVSGGSLPE